MSSLKTLILITGSRRGLGLSIKRQFENENFLVTSINRQQQNKTDFTWDLGVLNTHWQPTIEKIIKNFDKIIFINNAGIIDPVASSDEISPDDIVKATNVNWLNPVLMMNEIIKSSKSFYLLNITSGAAFGVNAKLSVYSSTKAAIHRYIEIVAKENTDNTRCMGIYNFDPGRMQTDMQKHLLIALNKADNDFFYTSLPTSDEIAKKIYDKIQTDIHNAKND